MRMTMTSLISLALVTILFIFLSWTRTTSSSSCQVYPSEYAYRDNSVTTAESITANCRRYSAGNLPTGVHPDDYIRCDGIQLKLTDSNFGQEQYQPTDYYVWSSRSEQLLFIFPTRVSLTNITLHYYSDSIRGLPRLSFYTVPVDFDIWDVPTISYPQVGVASVLPGGEPAGRRRVSVNVNFNTKKLLMFKYSSSFSFAMSEVEFLNCTESLMTTPTTTERPTLPSVPSPMVKIISSITDPVLIGTSLRLTCIVEWTMAVPRSVDIQATWTGPNGSSLISDLVTKTSSRYISEVELDSIDSTHQGEYTCTINIGNEISLSAKKTLTVGDTVFQIRLKRVGDGQLWTADKASSFRRQIEDALITAVESRCKCHFPNSHLLKGSFHCQSSSTHIIYNFTTE